MRKRNKRVLQWMILLREKEILAVKWKQTLKVGTDQEFTKTRAKLSLLDVLEYNFIFRQYKECFNICNGFSKRRNDILLIFLLLHMLCIAFFSGVLKYTVFNLTVSCTNKNGMKP